MQSESRSILVVGGAGYIGSVCAAHLRERGHRVTVLDDLSTGHRAAVPGDLVVGDVRDRALVRRVLREGRVDGVMHFAAKALVGESASRPLMYFDNNVGGVIALVDAMTSEGVRSLVFSSSCAVYGDPIRLPLDEDHPKSPVSPYGLSKWMAEQVLSECREREGLRVTCLRYFNAAGATPDGALGESHAHETHLIPLAIGAALGTRGPLDVFGDDWNTRDGTCTRDYVHVLDLADAHARALDRLMAGEAGGAYNLGTGRGQTVREVLESVGRVLGRPVPHRVVARRAGDAEGLWAANDRAREGLGWEPEWTDLDRVVETAIRWARAPRH